MTCTENTSNTPAGLLLDSRFQAGQDDGSLRDSSGFRRNLNTRSRTPVELALRLVADGSRPAPMTASMPQSRLSRHPVSIRLPLAVPRQGRGNNLRRSLIVLKFRLRMKYSHPDLSSSLRLSCYPAFLRSLAGRPVGYFHTLLVPPEAA